MSKHRVAIVAGARTPFVKSGKAFAALGPSALANHAVRGLLDRHRVNPERIDAIAFGAVVPERGKPNLAREIVLETGLPAHIEGANGLLLLYHRPTDGHHHRRRDSGMDGSRRASPAASNG